MYRRFSFATIRILRNAVKTKDSFKNNRISNFKSLSYDGRFRDFSTSSLENKPNNLEKVGFEEFGNLIKDQKVVVIDVREPNELIEYGALPRCLNIPLGEIEATLKDMPNDVFLTKYGQNKPNKETSIVVSCMRGGRSENAQLIAWQLGYKNVKNYIGGWTEWAEKSKTV